MRIFLLTITILVFGISNSYAETSPSFDCSKATTDVEKLICSDEELAKLDVEMNEAYNKFMDTLDDDNKKKLVSKQKIWLNNRGKVICMQGEDADKKKKCLKHIYETRIKRLNDWTVRSDWAFFVDEVSFSENETIKFLSKNGEEYIFYFSADAFFNIPQGKIFPSYPEEKLIYYFRSSDALEGGINTAFKNGILKQDEKEIVLWTGGRKTDINTFTDEEKVSIVSYFSPELSSSDILKILEILTNVYPDKISETSRVSKKCNNVIEQIKRGNYKILQPSFIANSYEEIKAKYNIKCSKNDLLTYNYYNNNYILHPPYKIYKIENNFMITGGGGGTKNIHDMTPPFVLKTNKCKESKNLNQHGDILLEIKGDLYVLHIPYARKKLRDNNTNIIWSITELKSSSYSEEQMDCHLVYERWNKKSQ